MKRKQKIFKSTLWLTIRIVGIFILVQLTVVAIGNWNTASIAAFLLSITLIVFVIAFISARIKEKRKNNTPPSHIIASR